MKKKQEQPNPLAPSVSLLCKLGSVAVHMDEVSSAKGHGFDWYAMQTLLNDPEVSAWLKAMDGMALIPKKR